MKDDEAKKMMTARALRRWRPVDVARAYQSAAHAANPQRRFSILMDLDVGKPLGRHVPPERAEQLALLGDAAYFRASYRAERRAK